jgi:hypothetical protein
MLCLSTYHDFGNSIQGPPEEGEKRTEIVQIGDSSKKY